MRKNSLLDALMPLTRQRILALTLSTPDRWWYLSEIAESLGLTASSLQRELDSLSQASILLMRRDGRRTYYKANEAGAIFLELRGIVRKTAGVAEEIRAALPPLSFGDMEADRVLVDHTESRVQRPEVPDSEDEEESTRDDAMLGDSTSDFID
ncbi:MAG: winged helix-turn-helix domain-containing protein [Thermoanaerobaculia bacterium]